jgi:hypothetical protein
MRFNVDVCEPPVQPAWRSHRANLLPSGNNLIQSDRQIQVANFSAAAAVEVDTHLVRARKV